MTGNGFLTNEELRTLLYCSRGTASKVISSLNKELKEKGRITILGRVPRLYFYKRTGVYSELANKDYRENVYGLHIRDVEKILKVSYEKASVIVATINKKVGAKGYLTYRGVVLSPFFFQEFNYLGDNLLGKPQMQK